MAVFFLGAMLASAAFPPFSRSICTSEAALLRR
jgi:hypothetical protein